MYWPMNPAIILAAVIAIAISGGVGYYKGGKDKQAEWDAEKLEIANAFAAELARVREREAVLQDAADKLRKAKDDEIRSVNARADALFKRLRDRESRAEGMPETASVGRGSCTGAQLYREDGEFLVRLAREADELRIAYKQCRDQYETIRQGSK